MSRFRVQRFAPPRNDREVNEVCYRSEKSIASEIALPGMEKRNVK